MMKSNHDRVFCCPNCYKVLTLQEMRDEWVKQNTLDVEVVDHVNGTVEKKVVFDDSYAPTDKELVYRLCACGNVGYVEIKSEEEKTMAEKINWEALGGQFVKLEQDVPKTMVLTGWRPCVIKYQDKTNNGVHFDVLEVNDEPVEKTFETSSALLIPKLRTIIQNAEEAGRDKVKVTITKTGNMKTTNYLVKEERL